jgi:hypothetical protein
MTLYFSCSCVTAHVRNQEMSTVALKKTYHNCCKIWYLLAILKHVNLSNTSIVHQMIHYCINPVSHSKTTTCMKNLARKLNLKEDKRSLHLPKWFIASLTNRSQSSTIEMSVAMTITSGDPSSRALSATARRRSSLLAERAKQAPLLAYSYARYLQKRQNTVRALNKQYPSNNGNNIPNL